MKKATKQVSYLKAAGIIGLPFIIGFVVHGIGGAILGSIVGALFIPSNQDNQMSRWFKYFMIGFMALGLIWLFLGLAGVYEGWGEEDFNPANYYNYHTETLTLIG